LASHWGTKLTGSFILINTSIITFGGSGYLLSVASQNAAFARDGGLPFSHIFCRINPKTNMPIYSIALLVSGSFLTLLFGLSLMARTIIFSLSVISNLITMSLPMCMRLFAGERFVPGPFNYGRFSKFVHAWALLSTCWLVVMESFPASPEWTLATFNFNWVITLGVFMLAVIIWFTFGKKNYKGLDLDAIATWRRSAGDE
jgi:amino acid transporter